MNNEQCRRYGTSVPVTRPVAASAVGASAVAASAVGEGGAGSGGAVVRAAAAAVVAAATAAEMGLAGAAAAPAPWGCPASPSGGWVLGVAAVITSPEMRAVMRSFLAWPRFSPSSISSSCEYAASVALVAVRGGRGGGAATAIRGTAGKDLSDV